MKKAVNLNQGAKATPKAKPAKHIATKAVAGDLDDGGTKRGVSRASGKK